MSQDNPQKVPASTGVLQPDPAGLTSGGWLLVAGAVLLCGLVFLFWISSPSRGGGGEVVVYAAQDQVFAEPILQEFTRQTGIRVRTVFDSEAVKTVGLANRLLAETNRPQADLFWGNEELRTRQLAARGVFRQTNGWAAFGFRSRRLVVNTNLAPRLGENSVVNLQELTNAVWRGKVALAYPLFGTTATHFHALRQWWGTEAWEHWCRALRANQPLVVDGNSVVVQLVGRGEAAIGLTDSDDIIAGRRRGYPIVALPLTREMLLIPNTVGVVQGAPNPTVAEVLYRRLQSSNVVQALVACGALEGVTPVASSQLPVPWEKLLSELEDTQARLKQIFLR